MGEPTSIVKNSRPSIERTKSEGEIRAQLERIYARTGGQYSGNPRRIKADIIGYQYLKNISNLPENKEDYQKIGGLLRQQLELKNTKYVRNREEKIKALESQIREIGERMNGRRYTKSAYAKQQ